MAINIDKDVENKKESLLTPGEEAAELLLKNKDLEKQEEKQEALNFRRSTKNS